jgi:YYY domain-containing protein
MVRDHATELLLVLILVLGAWLRLTGLNWDENQHLHPDERFLTMVESDIRFPDSLGQYFDTDHSPLNPHNAGHGFFVYGTLPIFLVKALAVWTSNTGYDQITLLGRATSGCFDLLSVVLVYFIGTRLYRRRVGLLAAAFAAFSVLLIQHSHFFVVDPFANTFILAGFYFAVRALDEGGWKNHRLFGLALGMAVASKISAAPLAGVIVLADLVRIWRADPDGRQTEFNKVVRQLAEAALISVLVFRICQPYAFAGPGFFGVRLNPRWLANMAEIRNQSAGTVDVPFALQWANRTPILFALKNLVLWGMGLPLGVTAWLAWFWALLCMAKGDWKRHLLPVVWTGAFFLWQSSGFTPSMRYQMPVYPTLALLASWGLWQVWEGASRLGNRWRKLAMLGAAVLGGGVLLATFAWAVAFASIYTRPVTRVAASRWIFSQLPGLVNLSVETPEGSLLEPVPMPQEFVLSDGVPMTASFINNVEGSARAFFLSNVAPLTQDQGPITLEIRLLESPDPSSEIARAAFSGVLDPAAENRIELPLDSAVPVSVGRTYYLEAELLGRGAVTLRGGVNLMVATAEGDQAQPIDLPRDIFSVGSSVPYLVTFTSHTTGSAQGVLLPHVTVLPAQDGPLTVSVVLLENTDAGPQTLATATHTMPTPPEGETRLEFAFSQAIEIQSGRSYSLQLSIASSGALLMRGSVIINESTWDDGLPLRLDGRDMGGLYTGVVQELYWADETDEDGSGASDKLERLVSTLAEGDILAITSNRQHGTIPRVPIRYPLTTAYYRALFNCPAPEAISSCADRARPGLVSEGLGYELIAVFKNNPRIGPWEISDQAAEEAFTVYDHPEVFIFARMPGFSEQRVADLLNRVDLSSVVHVTPSEAGAPPKDLLLPADRLQEQRAGGTWSELFDRNSLVNRYQVVAVIGWWLLVAAIGWAALPITRAAFPGLADGGYPLSRLVGLVVVAWGSWLLGSFRVPFTRLTILLVAAAMVAVSAVLAWRDRRGLADFLRRRRKEILWVEALALIFFLVDLGIRLGNPDLWHPWKGGEKPMDLSYLNAVLKSTSFPPFDPWFAGGYINYYYYGFVIVAVPIKLLGLNPVVAYNLAIPTIFSLLAMAAYCVGFNLLAGRSGEGEGRWLPVPNARVAGLAAAVAVVILGNLGIVSMVYNGFVRLGTPEGQSPGRSIMGLVDASRGVVRFLANRTPLPYGADAWYWDPSRAIPAGAGEAGPITEFPFFTFLYADLHAHMISRPVAVLCIAWCLSWLLAAGQKRVLKLPGAMLAVFIGALAFGAIRPTNLGDYPVYWGLGAVTVVVAAWLRRGRPNLGVLLEAGVAAIGLIGLTYLCYLPYYQWYGQAYGAIELWRGSRTPLSAYLTVHGVFLFAILSWMAWETVQWLAKTPLSALSKWRAYFGPLGWSVLFLLAAIVVLAFLGYAIAPLVILMMVWAGILILRPGMELEKRIVLALTGAGLALTFLVEVVVIRGDISRMNTVFKFYLQVWEMFGLAAAASLMWMWEGIQAWKPSWRQAWGVAMGVLVVSAAMYPIVATVAKIRDRMAPEAPHSLDGTAFMPFATYYDVGTSISLAEDFRAIQWMQDQVQGSPVIVEANLPEYRWGSRFTIYTGLPGVLGWNWHQRQQRVLAGDADVWQRAFDISSFYMSSSVDLARDFLARYQVRYVIVGQLERMYYEELSPCLVDETEAGVRCDMTGRVVVRDCGAWCHFDIAPSECTVTDAQTDPSALTCPTEGLAKFERMVAQGLLRQAYRDGGTVIYEVIQ